MGSEVSAGLGGQIPDSGRVAGLAKDVSIKGVAALVVTFGQEDSAVLTAVTINVEVAVQGDNANGLLLTDCRHDWLPAH